MNEHPLVFTARDRLSKPPAENVTRPEFPNREPDLELVASLEMCPTGNKTRHQPGWSAGKDKAALAEHVANQLFFFGPLMREKAPRLGKRPLVVAVRFCRGRRPDRYANWAKRLIDVLTHAGMWTDDDENGIDERQWSEPAPPGGAPFVYLAAWRMP